MSKDTTSLKTQAENRSSDPYRRKAMELVAKMTLEEKAGLCSGQNFWNLKEVERLGLHRIMVCDGPHGLRKLLGDGDNLGLGKSIPSVCFPTASALACSFDRALAFEVGAAIGEECLQEEISVVLGPGANQKRSPLCGRNFEYFSEDPILSGEMAAGMINGVQSKGIGTSLKHFAVNNQEKRRMTISAVVDERALRETYLKAFEIAIKKSKPWTVMCAYNRLDGEYCSENEYLLTKILREDWGFEGLVMSDWGAVNNRVLGVMAGLDLEMPGSQGRNDRKLVAAVLNKSLPEEELDRAAGHVTELILKSLENKKPGFKYDAEAHHQLAVMAAEQSAVLLKNEAMLLPGSPEHKAAVIGAFAKTPRYQGAGSSKINSIKVDNAWDALQELGAEITYAAGYRTDTFFRKDRREEDRLIAEACEVAKGKDIVYLFAGLPEGYESEGFDRSSLSLPENHNRLIEAVADCNPNTVVILIGGAPVELSWEGKVKSILLAYLGGDGGGTAIANLLLGKAIPCGKLAETWPIRLEDTPAYHYYPGGRATVEYRESIFVGYRYYEAAGKQVRYPFGHGLSYTEFTYSGFSMDQSECHNGEQLQITFHVTNQGKMAAKETAMIFVGHRSDSVYLPKKELREFVKLTLEPGETKQVTVTLDTADFGYYNTLIKDWYVESGDYEIFVGPSSMNCPLKGVLRVHSGEQLQPDMRVLAPSYYNLRKEDLVIPSNEFEAIYGGSLPDSNLVPKKPYHEGNTLEDVKHTLTGKLLLFVISRMAKKMAGGTKEEENMVAASIGEMPLQALISSAQGNNEKLLEGMLDLLNGHLIRGIIRLLKK